jgi:hypothetical protein
MIRPYALLSTIVLTTATYAQNWAVGVPINVQVTEITVNGGGCSPGPQATLFLGAPPVTGMTYYYEVVSITNGVYTMIPGPAGILAVGDTIHLGPGGANTVFNQQTSGSLQLRAKVQGTPTVAGQSHPCNTNSFWISNLLLCNEGLSTTLLSGCTTQDGSTIGISELTGESTWFVSNGNALRITDNSVRSAQVIDAQGKVVAATNTIGGSLDLGTEPTGIYVVRAQRANGEVVTKRIVVSH